MLPRSSCRSLGALVWLLSITVAGCGGGGTEPRVPSNVVVTPTDIAFDAVGETQQITATVTDADGATIPSPSITWSSTNTAVAAVSSTGLVSGAGAGTAAISATAGSATASANVTVTQTPTQLQTAAGDQQTVNVGQSAPTPLTVQVNDGQGHPIAGVTVTFSVAAESGILGTPSAVTGSDGRAATSLTVLAVGTMQVTAAVTGTSLTATFTETGVSPFAIELQFETTATPAQQQAFVAARKRWESLIVGDLPNVQLTAGAGTCGTGSPALQRQVDDVLILVSLEDIDGPGNVLGASGPCFIRNTSRLPVLGLMRFDTADLDVLETTGLLQTVITHEMGHVLGYGTIWSDLNLLADPSLAGGTDPHFTGAGAIAAFNAVGGASYNAGAKVPVEDSGGEGTADSHWRESVFDNELMTGFVQPGSNPLSRVTIASMADMGYTVNLAGADPYTLAPALRVFAQGRKIELKNDLIRVPLHVVNEAGQVVRVVQP